MARKDLASCMASWRGRAGEIRRVLGLICAALPSFPGFRSFREIIAELTREGEKPLQGGDWDAMVLPLGASLYLGRDCSVMRLIVERDNSVGEGFLYPHFRVRKLVFGDWRTIIQTRSSTVGLFEGLRSLLATVGVRASAVPTEASRILSQIPSAASAT